MHETGDSALSYEGLVFMPSVIPPAGLAATNCKHAINFYVSFTVKYNKEEENKKKDVLVNMKKNYFSGDLGRPLQRMDRVSGWWARVARHADTRVHTCSIHSHVFGDGITAGKCTSG